MQWTQACGFSRDDLQMKKLQTSKGGAREGAGRKASEDPKKSRTIRATDAQWETFKYQGGNGWLTALLDSLVKKSAK